MNQVLANSNNFEKKINALEILTDMMDMSKKNSERIIDQSSDLLIIVDSFGSIFRGNHELAKLMNIHIEETITFNIDILFDSEIGEKMLNFINTSNSANNTITLPIKSKYTGKAEVIQNNYQWKINILHLPKDSMMQLYIINGRYIGDILWSAHELELLNSELEKKVEDRTNELKLTHQRMIKLSHYTGMAEVASNILHNLGNGVTSAFGNLQILKRKVTKDTKIEIAQKEEYEKIINKLLKQVDNMTKVIKTQEKYVIRNVYKENLTLSQVIKDTLHILKDTLHEEKITVAFQHDDTNTIYSSPPKLNNIFMIILTNAITALKHTHQKSIKINIHNNTVHIHDNGMGILQENIVNIFNHGFTTWAEHDGYGLHTAINLVKELGGQINVESPGLDMGSTFIVTFNQNQEKIV